MNKHKFYTGGLSRKPSKWSKWNERMTVNNANNLEYPYRILYTSDEEMQESYKRLQNYTLDMEIKPFTIPLLPDLDCSFDGESRVIIVDKEDYDTVGYLSDIFNEHVRVHCKRYNEPLSPYEYWQRHHRHIVTMLVRQGYPVTVRNLAEALYKKVKGCTTFHPELLPGTVKWLLPDRDNVTVLDISSGWGDRLLGAVSHGYNYIGADPNSALHDGYKRIIETYGDATKQRIICSPFQSADLEGVEADIVFTSPPYFAVEEYSSETTQSIIEFDSVDKWFNGFLVPSLEKAWRHLKQGGHLVLHINNMPGEDDYVMRMRDHVNTFEGAYYRGIVGKVYRREFETQDICRARPVWIWTKK